MRDRRHHVGRSEIAACARKRSGLSEDRIVVNGKAIDGEYSCSGDAAERAKWAQPFNFDDFARWLDDGTPMPDRSGE